MRRVWGRRLNPRLDGRKRGREWGRLGLSGRLSGETVQLVFTSRNERHRSSREKIGRRLTQVDGDR
jgi:hypothetical protein